MGKLRLKLEKVVIGVKIPKSTLQYPMKDIVIKKKSQVILWNALLIMSNNMHIIQLNRSNQVYTHFHIQITSFSRDTNHEEHF